MAFSLACIAQHGASAGFDAIMVVHPGDSLGIELSVERALAGSDRDFARADVEGRGRAHFQRRWTPLIASFRVDADGCSIRCKKKSKTYDEWHFKLHQPQSAGISLESERRRLLELEAAWNLERRAMFDNGMRCISEIASWSIIPGRKDKARKARSAGRIPKLRVPERRHSDPSAATPSMLATRGRPQSTGSTPSTLPRRAATCPPSFLMPRVAVATPIPRIRDGTAVHAAVVSAAGQARSELTFGAAGPVVAKGERTRPAHPTVEVPVAVQLPVKPGPPLSQDARNLASLANTLWHHATGTDSRAGARPPTTAKTTGKAFAPGPEEQAASSRDMDLKGRLPVQSPVPPSAHDTRPDPSAHGALGAGSPTVVSRGAASPQGHGQGGPDYQSHQGSWVPGHGHDERGHRPTWGHGGQAQGQHHGQGQSQSGYTASVVSMGSSMRGRQARGGGHMGYGSPRATPPGQLHGWASNPPTHGPPGQQGQGPSPGPVHSRGAGHWTEGDSQFSARSAGSRAGSEYGAMQSPAAAGRGHSSGEGQGQGGLPQDVVQAMRVLTRHFAVGQQGQAVQYTGPVPAAQAMLGQPISMPQGAYPVDSAVRAPSNLQAQVLAQPQAYQGVPMIQAGNAFAPMPMAMPMGMVANSPVSLGQLSMPMPMGMGNGMGMGMGMGVGVPVGMQPGQGPVLVQVPISGGPVQGGMPMTMPVTFIPVMTPSGLVHLRYP